MAKPSRQSLITLIMIAVAVSACGDSARVSRPDTTLAGKASASEPQRLRQPQEPLSPVDPSAFGEDEIRIAVLLPLSGSSAPTGQALFDAVTLALFDSYDPRLRLLPFDTRGTPQGATAAARAAVSADPGIVVGPLFSESITAAAPIVSAAGLKLIGFSNDAKVASRDVLLLSFLPDDEIDAVVTFAAGQGARRFAGLIPESPYGEKVLRSLSDSVRRTGSAIAAIEVYPRDPQETAEPVKRLANYDERHREYLRETRFLRRLDDDLAEEILESLEKLETLEGPGFDAVLVPEGGELLRSLAPMLSYYEVDPKDVRYLGTGLWDDPDLRLEPSLEGAWFAGAPLESSRAFLERFERIFGYAPARIASLGYDAMSLVALLARHEIRGERFSDFLLFDPDGYSGVDGIFRFRRDGTVERRLSILEITPDGIRTVAAAPQSFRDPAQAVMSARR